MNDNQPKFWHRYRLKLASVFTIVATVLGFAVDMISLQEITSIEWLFQAPEDVLCDKLASDPDDVSVGRDGAGNIVNPERTIKVCQRAISIDPNNGQLHHQLGRAYFSAGKQSLAFEHFRKGAELGYPPAAAMHGRDLWANCRFREGLIFLEKAAEGSISGKYHLGELKLTDVNAPNVLTRDCKGGRALIEEAYAMGYPRTFPDISCWAK